MKIYDKIMKNCEVTMFFHNQTYNRILSNLLKNNIKARKLYMSICQQLPDEIKEKVVEGETLKYSNGTFALSMVNSDHLEIKIYNEELGVLMLNFYPLTRKSVADIPYDPKNEIFTDPDNAQDSPAYYNIVYYYPESKGDICVGYDFFVLKKANGFNLVSQETTIESGYVSTTGFYLSSVDIEDFIMNEKRVNQSTKKKPNVTFLV